jgi:hypothetical protein
MLHEKYSTVVPPRIAGGTANVYAAVPRFGQGVTRVKQIYMQK